MTDIPIQLVTPKAAYIHGCNDRDALAFREASTTISSKRHRFDSIGVGNHLQQAIATVFAGRTHRVEILVRLPVKSLIQYKCVCKTWKSLISDPQFAKSHLLSSNAHPQLVVSVIIGIANCHFVSYPLKLLLDNPSTPVETATLTTRHCTRIIGSCNGLLCFYYSPRSTFKLRNPSIKLKSKSSPTIIAFDSKRILYCGFGYDQVNDRYKVLAVVQNCYNLNETNTIIYTFAEKNWRAVQKFPCDPLCDCGDNNMRVGKFLSGTLNWIVNKEVIVPFDLEKKTYGQILLPQYNGCNPVLYLSSNRICVSFDHPKNIIVVWMMKEYGVVEFWTKLMIINQDKLISKIPHSRLSDALFILEHRVLFLRPVQSRLIMYNLDNDGGLDYRSTIFGRFAHHLQIYHESLVSPPW
jgi:F-box interacting protein